MADDRNIYRSAFCAGIIPGQRYSGDNAGGDVRSVHADRVAGHSAAPSVSGGGTVEQCEMDSAGGQVRCADDDYDEN